MPFRPGAPIVAQIAVPTLCQLPGPVMRFLYCPPSPAGSARSGCARRVGEAVERFARAVEGGEVAEIAAADVGIVAALLDETGSPVLCLCLNPIVQVVTRMHALRDAIYAEPRGNLEGWRALVAWLEERRPELIEVFAAELEARDQATLRRMRNRK